MTQATARNLRVLADQVQKDVEWVNDLSQVARWCVETFEDPQNAPQTLEFQIYQLKAKLAKRPK